MGYMGLDHYLDSDTAFDCASDIADVVAKRLQKELKQKGSWCNTSGPINVALIIEDLDNKTDFLKWNDNMKLVARDTIVALIKEVEGYKNPADWESKKNQQYHIKSVKRMIKNLQKLVDGE